MLFIVMWLPKLWWSCNGKYIYEKLEWRGIQSFIPYLWVKITTRTDCIYSLYQLYTLGYCHNIAELHFVNSLLTFLTFLMPSTRRQKAKERRSRQLDMMSDVESVDIMIGSYSRDEDRNERIGSELNLDLVSNRPQQSSNLNGEDFRSLLNTNSRENSEVTVETNRMISEESSNQMSRKLNEIKESLNYQIQDAISIAITDQILPSIQNTLN